MAEPSKEEFNAIYGLYLRLYSHIKTKESPDEPLLLAHYTSVETVERILKNGEVWFSNPLYMNDLEEMRAGIFLGSQLFPEFAQKADTRPDRIRKLIDAFNHYTAHLTVEAAIDTYVFCLCEHKHEDGLLSMWREYGRRGNGAALVLNTQKFNYQAFSPLIIAKVDYVSREQREQKLRSYLGEWAQITREANLPDDRIYLAAYFAFQFVKAVALTTKHHGFAEENEWRVIYVPERDQLGYLTSMLDYFVGLRGVEPKLKFKLGVPLRPESGTGDDLMTGALDDILAGIILGPTVSSPLAEAAFVKMLERMGKKHLKDRVSRSTIPLRPEP
jgi:hypothetical protein